MLHELPAEDRGSGSCEKWNKPKLPPDYTAVKEKFVKDLHSVLVIGHRGASHDYPENTLEAFEGAARQGADWVELDVRCTLDGALVVHHDPVLADGRAICETESLSLPPSVTTLALALAACPPMGV